MLLARACLTTLGRPLAVCSARNKRRFAVACHDCHSAYCNNTRRPTASAADWLQFSHFTFTYTYRQAHSKQRDQVCKPASLTFDLSQKRYEIYPWLLRNVSKSRVSDRSMSVPTTLSDLERRDAVGKIIQADALVPFDLTTKFGMITRGEERISTGQPRLYRNWGGAPALPILGVIPMHAHTLWCRTGKFDVVTRGERAWTYLGVSHASHPKRAEFQCSPILGVLYLCLHPLMQNDRIRHGNIWGWACF